MMDYSEVYRDLGNKLIEDYQMSKCVHPGINGPYNDAETEVRNLSHLIVIVAIEILKFGRKELSESIIEMGNQLLSMQIRPGLFVIRKKGSKDLCNGVIGHSWIIECLVYLYRVTNDSKFVDVAKNIVSNHKYNYREHLWSRPAYKSQTTIDYTLNHQLWFAASLAELNTIVFSYDKMLNDFLSGLKLNMSVHINGLICHTIYFDACITHSLKGLVRFTEDTIKRMIKCPSYEYREEGYHMFNIMALSRLREAFGKHEFFLSNKFDKCVNYINSKDFIYGLNRGDYIKDSTMDYLHLKDEEKAINIYGYPYNVPGLEIPYVKQILQSAIRDDVSEKCQYEQYNRIYNNKNGTYANVCYDKTIINYRVYEYYRYLEKSNRNIFGD